MSQESAGKGDGLAWLGINGGLESQHEVYYGLLFIISILIREKVNCVMNGVNSEWVEGGLRHTSLEPLHMFFLFFIMTVTGAQDIMCLKPQPHVNIYIYIPLIFNSSFH